MKLICEGRKTSGRGFVLLAPPQSHLLPFREVVDDDSRHQRLLTGAQKLRGEIYVRDGAIQPWELSAGGRHIQQADARSWHLMTVDERDRVTSCIRYYAHRPGVSFSDLAISRCAAAQSAEFGSKVREAVQDELAYASQRGFYYVELGGWAISPEIRCTSEALRMLLTVYALAQFMGGALGVSTATTRHHSSSILRRVGGRPLMARGTEVPSYVDPHYNCEMELLSFDSTSPDAHYDKWIRECRTALVDVPVVSSETQDTDVALLHLHEAITRQQDQPANLVTANL
jgi:hypothetical protein